MCRCGDRGKGSGEVGERNDVDPFCVKSVFILELEKQAHGSDTGIRRLYSCNGQSFSFCPLFVRPRGLIRSGRV